MKYIDIDVLKGLQDDPKIQAFIKKSEMDVKTFFTTFKDNPAHTSRWGHHYFCKEDGGLLKYDMTKPHEHTCSICGTSYSNDLLDGVWVYMYRNQGVVNAWLSALLYRLTDDKQYLTFLLDYVDYYTENYLSFELHNKEGLHFDSIEDMAWGCSRIMPQSLNESIYIIRMINALELVKEDLEPAFIENLDKKFLTPAFEMFKPQVHKIHNISCWLNSAIGVMGLFLNDKDMTDFCFDGEFNINKQLEKGVTDDQFWYEGSIHYNFFTLEGMVNLLLFSELYGYDFPVGKTYIKNMLEQTYHYAFDSHQLPNPNDGWPNVNLKSYSYIFAVAYKIYGEGVIADIFKSIIQKDGPRNEFPLSKPCYLDDLALEEVLFCPQARHEVIEPMKIQSEHFDTSFCGLLKNERLNVFYKYGHNGPSHAHPDKMTIEVTVDGASLSRDLSNSGYGNTLCNEWHRVSASHNTVVINGENHTSVEGGLCHLKTSVAIAVEAKDVYKGVDYKRTITLNDLGYDDAFEVTNADGTSDYFFHVEGELTSTVKAKPADLGFKENGYQHLKDIVEVEATDRLELEWKLNETTLKSLISLDNKTLYMAQSPDNPVTGYRTTLIIRSTEQNPAFNMKWEIGV